MKILKLENLRKYFGGIKAVDGVSLEIGDGEFVGLIGPNGCGKTTLFNVISGVYKPDGGAVYFRGEKISGLDPHKIFLKGIVRSFQNPSLFLGMTVLENAMLPPRNQLGEIVFKAPFGRKWHKQEVSFAEKALETLDKREISDISQHWSRDISGGQMKLLECCRAMMGEPQFFLLDEPTAGVAPKLARNIYKFIVKLRNELGVPFFIIEHRLEILLDYVERVLVMHEGRILSDGTPKEVVNDPAVIDAYLGE